MCYLKYRSPRKLKIPFHNVHGGLQIFHYVLNWGIKCFKFNYTLIGPNTFTVNSII